MKHVDVAIIGGSLAGAACVRELARRGIDAVAFERDRFPREKVCGGFLSPGAVDLLDELEVLDAVRAAGATTVRASTIRIGGREIPVELQTPGLGISRRTLDAIVADHSGVQQGFVRGVDREREGFRVQLEGTEVAARVVVDAAGKLSRFSQRKAVPQFGLQFYEKGEGSEVLDFWFFDQGYGGALMVEGGRVNACFLVYRDVLAGWVGDEGKARTGHLNSVARGFCPPESGGQRGPAGSREGWFPGKLWKDSAVEPPPARSRLRLNRAALLTQEGKSDMTPDSACLVTGPLAFDRLPSDFISVGDAAGMVDPFCGEGMRHALDTGIGAAKAIASGLKRGENYDVMRARYEQDSSRRWNRKRKLSKIIRHMLKHPRLTSFGLGLNPEYWFRKLWD